MKKNKDNMLLYDILNTYDITHAAGLQDEVDKAINICGDIQEAIDNISYSLIDEGLALYKINDALKSINKHDYKWYLNKDLNVVWIFVGDISKVLPKIKNDWKLSIPGLFLHADVHDKLAALGWPNGKKIVDKKIKPILDKIKHGKTCGMCKDCGVYADIQDNLCGFCRANQKELKLKQSKNKEDTKQQLWINGICKNLCKGGIWMFVESKSNLCESCIKSMKSKNKYSSASSGKILGQNDYDINSYIEENLQIPAPSPTIVAETNNVMKEFIKLTKQEKKKIKKKIEKPEKKVESPLKEFGRTLDIDKE